MRFKIIQKILGILLMIFSVTMLPAALVSVYFNEYFETWSFLYAFFFIMLAGTVFWLPAVEERAELRVRDGFLVVVLFWVVLGVLGAFLSPQKCLLPSFIVQFLYFASMPCPFTSFTSDMSCILYWFCCIEKCFCAYFPRDLQSG